MSIANYLIAAGSVVSLCGIIVSYINAERNRAQKVALFKDTFVKDILLIGEKTRWGVLETMALRLFDLSIDMEIPDKQIKLTHEVYKLLQDDYMEQTAKLIKLVNK